MRLLSFILVFLVTSFSLAENPAPERKTKVPRWQKRFVKRDLNKDKSLDKEEFKGRPEVFQRFDANKDGLISLEEYKKFFRFRRRRAKQRKNNGASKGKMFPKKWIKKRDLNEDGQVGKDEFKGKPKFFEKFDLDKDGFLSLQEVRKMPKFSKRRKNKNKKHKGKQTKE